MRHFPAPAREYVPPYKFASYATHNKFLDLVDNHPPMYATDVFPGPKDFKEQKFTFTFTSAPAGQPTTFFKHNLDLPQALSMLKMMLYGDQGDPARDGMLRGFPDMKGYPDPMYKQWSHTSHVFEIKYMTQLGGTPIRTGPNYALQFSFGPGTPRMVNGKSGIVMPQSGAQVTRASVMMPIFGNKDTKPYAAYFAEQALSYIQAREACRLQKMMLSGVCSPFSASPENPRRQCMRIAALATEVASHGRGGRTFQAIRARTLNFKQNLTPRTSRSRGRNGTDAEPTRANRRSLEVGVRYLGRGGQVPRPGGSGTSAGGRGSTPGCSRVSFR